MLCKKGGVVMKKSTAILLIIATSLVVLGCAVFGCAVIMMNGDLAKMGTNKYETNEHDISEEFKSIAINTDTADIELIPSEDEKCSVVCFERIHAKHDVSVNDGVLTIKLVDSRKWYEYIGINFSTPKITVYIPQGEYGKLSIKSSTGDVKIPKEFKFENIDISESTGNVTNYASASENIIIKTSTGNIRVENVSAGTLDLSVSTGGITVSNVTCEGNVKIDVSTGKTNLTNIECKNIVSSGNTGAISLKNVIATEKFSIERSTGDVRFEGSDATEISVKTDTGDVTGTLLSEKVFITETSIGRINVPKTTSGGKCEITTATGDINISTKQ
jgi:DUF4097 and DUF4098 domain-containing protein YvlB